MAATFDPTLAAAKDRIRQRIGDTDPTRARIQDETIAAYIAQGMTELGVARRLCLDIAAVYAGIGDVHLDDQRQSYGQIYQHYMDLARAIAAEERPASSAAAAGSRIIVGGIGDCRGPIDSWADESGYLPGIPITGP